MTCLEDLSISAHFSFLTNTKIVAIKWNDLLFYKIVVSLIFVCVIIFQIRIWKFKRNSAVNVSISVNFSKTTTKYYQKTVGKVTLRIVLTAISIQLFYYLMMKHKYNSNFTDSYIQNLRLVTCSQIFTMNFLPMVWILTTPNMMKSFVTRLQKIKQKFRKFFFELPTKPENKHCVHFHSIISSNVNQEDISNPFPIPITSNSFDTGAGNGMIPLQSNTSPHQRENSILEPKVGISSRRNPSKTPIILPISGKGKNNSTKYIISHGSHAIFDDLPPIDC